CLLVVIAFFLSSCANFKDIGSNLGDGLSSSLQNRDSLFSSIGGNITKGARDSLINETLSRNLSRVLDSVVINFSSTSKRELSSLIDSLLSDYVAIRVARIGGSFQESISRIPDNLLGERTSFLVRNLRNDLLGDSTA